MTDARMQELKEMEITAASLNFCSFDKTFTTEGHESSRSDL